MLTYTIKLAQFFSLCVQKHPQAALVYRLASWPLLNSVWQSNWTSASLSDGTNADFLL